MAQNRTSLADPLGEFDDWVELENNGAEPVELEGLTLSDDRAELGKLVFDAALVLDPGERLVVWTDNDPEQGLLHADFRLSADGEEIVLATAAGEVIDGFAFGPQCPDVSFGRPLGGGSPAFLASPTPGQENTEARAEAPDCAPPLTDAGPEPEPAAGIVLNEVAPAGAVAVDDGDELEPWVELHNPTAEALDLSAHRLTDDPALPERWVFPDGFVVGPGAYRLVFLDAEPLEGLDHASFRPDPDGGELRLSGPGGEQLSLLRFGASEVGQTWGPGEVLLAAATPAAENVQPFVPDAGSGDGGAPGPVDAGAGTPADAGPEPTDAGPPPTDAGPEALDAGALDGGA